MKLLITLCLLLAFTAHAEVVGVTVLGVNTDVDIANVPEDLWSAGNAYVFPTAANATTVVSTSTNDAAAGTGARTILLWGLDASYGELIETVTLNGTTLVPAANNFFRINGAKVLTAGSGLTNAGGISILHSGTVLSKIVASSGETGQAIHTVAKQARILGWCGSVYVTSGAYGTLQLLVTDGSNGVFRIVAEMGLGIAGQCQQFLVPVSVSAKSDIKMRASNISASDSTVSGMFFIQK